MIKLVNIIIILCGVILSYVSLCMFMLNIFRVELPYLGEYNITMFILLYLIFPILILIQNRLATKLGYTKIISLFFLFFWINALFCLIYALFQK